MTQKELSYIEDIYNHEILIINIINNYSSLLEENIIKKHLEIHKCFLKQLDELMKG